MSDNDLKMEFSSDGKTAELMSGVKKKRKKARRRTIRVLVSLIAVFVLGVMSVQLYNLYRTDAAYAKKERELEADLSAQQDRQEELSNYEAYTRAEEYMEGIAKSKLGMVHKNEIIFRESDD